MQLHRSERKVGRARMTVEQVSRRIANSSLCLQSGSVFYPSLERKPSDNNEIESMGVRRIDAHNGSQRGVQ